MLPSKNQFIILGLFIVLFDLGINTVSKPKEKETTVLENAFIISKSHRSIFINSKLILSDRLNENNYSSKKPIYNSIINTSEVKFIKDFPALHDLSERDIWNIISKNGRDFITKNFSYEYLNYRYISYGNLISEDMFAF